MELIVKLVSALAWPITVIAIVLVFRREFRAAAGRLRTLSFKDIKADFERDLQKLEGEVRQLPEKPIQSLPEHTDKKPLQTDETVLQRLTEISPRAAIMEAWRNIEVTTKQVADVHGISVGGNIAGVRSINELVRKGLLPGSVLPVYERMRRLRARAAHAEDFAIEQNEAERYIEMAHEFHMSLRFLLKQAEGNQRRHPTSESSGQ
jgi:hypothetical protein